MMVPVGVSSMLQTCLLLEYLFSAVHAAAHPAITPSPDRELLRRQDDVGSAFLGYTSFAGDYYAQSCGPGSTLTLSQSWAACRPTSADTFTIATGCESDSILIAPSTEYPCGSNLCYSIFLYQSLDDETPHSLYGCDSVDGEYSLYAATTSSGEESTSSGTSTKTSTASTTESTIISSGASSTSTTGFPLPTGLSPGSDSDSDSDSKSGSGSGGRNLAWIAGPIVGGIAGIVIIVLLVWIAMLLRKRRADQPVASNPPYQQAQYYQNEGQAYPGYLSPTQTQYSPHGELHGHSVTPELQAETKPH